MDYIAGFIFDFTFSLIRAISGNNRRPTKMEGINREYATRVHNYIVAMTYYEDLLDKGEILIEDYITIELKILSNYKLSEDSIFRMKKRACEYGSTIETVEL